MTNAKIDIGQISGLFLPKTLESYTGNYVTFIDGGDGVADALGELPTGDFANSTTKDTLPSWLPPLDLARSYLIEPWEQLEGDDDDIEVMTEKMEAEVTEELLSGTCYARLMKSSPLEAECVPGFVRAATKGGLSAAFNAAMQLFCHEEYMTLDENAVIEAEYLSKLSEIEDPSLRSHVSCYCLDQESVDQHFGGMVSSALPDFADWLAKLGFRLLVGWEFNEVKVGIFEELAE